MASAILPRCVTRFRLSGDLTVPAGKQSVKVPACQLIRLQTTILCLCLTSDCVAGLQQLDDQLIGNKPCGLHALMKPSAWLPVVGSEPGRFDQTHPSDDAYL